MIKALLRLLKRYFFTKKLIGDINKKLLVTPVYINDKEFGESTKLPTVLEINIDENPRPDFIDEQLLNEVGQIVRKKYFDFDFLFNVSFSCSKPKFLGKDKYADPYSIWFNVFFGFYELDISVDERNYPFGFNEDLTVNSEEILKLGKSDWNYFSNFLYGVPFKFITNDVTDIHTSEIENSHVEKIKIDNMDFYKLTVESFKVISPYQSDEGRSLTEKANNFLWQLIFGFPVSRKEFPNSFIPTNMKAVMYIYHKDITGDYDIKKEHSTFIFGGTINLDYPQNALKNPKNKKSLDELESENKRFLELQLREIRKIIPKVLK